jgi:hypothetical protein
VQCGVKIRCMDYVTAYEKSQTLRKAQGMTFTIRPEEAFLVLADSLLQAMFLRVP